MRFPQRLLAPGLLSALMLSGCNVGDSGSVSTNGGGTGGVAQTGNGNGTSSGTSGTFNTGDGNVKTVVHDSVVATPSVNGSVSVATGSSRALSVAFTSSDGARITGFAISGTTLPAGWSGPADFTCASVTTGADCVVTLTFAPTAVGTGTLTINYVFVDSANAPHAPGGSIDIPYAATANDNIVASISPKGQVIAGLGESPQPVSVNFTTDNGTAAAAFAITTDLAALPPGWSSTAASFACDIVSTGNGCALALKYAPAAAAGGTLVLSYSYVDDAGTARTGAVNIPYVSAARGGTVVASVSPDGQVNAVQKGGGQSVAVTFDTADGKPASNLFVTSGLASLPAGWSSALKKFSCSAVSTGNGCQLRLSYAPAALTSGTVTLEYTYDDQSNAMRRGTVDLVYAATTDDNVAATASPSGQINAVVGMGAQSVLVTFNTDDSRFATALSVTNVLPALPAGWSSASNAFECGAVSSGNGCQLALLYAPAAADSGNLALNFSYTNNAGKAKTSSISIPYRATTNDSIVGTPSQPTLAVLTGSSTSVDVTFTTDDGNLASGLTITSGLSPLPLGWTSTATTFACASVSTGTTCRLPLAYAPTAADTGTLMLGFSYVNDAGIAKTGTTAITYTAN